MPDRKPLVMVGGKIKEISSTDTIPAANIPAGATVITVYADQTPDNGTYGALAGSVNGSNAIFTVAQGSYLTGTLQVYRNGQLQTQGATNDFQETSPGSGTFTFVTAPLTGDVITAIYQKAVVSLAGGNLSGALNFKQGADIASASTTDIGAATGNYVTVTGTTTITGLGTIQAGTVRYVDFTGALILTHNATSLILPSGANITTAAGDCAIFISEGSGNWRCIMYQRATGQALVAPFLPLSGGNMTGAMNAAKGNDIASASTTDIGAATGNYVVVTGTTTITALGTAQAGTMREVRFSGALTLTHNATSLILPTSGDILTAAGDAALFVSEGSGNWRCLCYRRFNGAALYPFRVANESTGAQAISANTDTYITGSMLDIPNGKLAAGSRILWRFVATKTAAGTATPVWNVRFGTNGSTADTSRITFTGDAQTGAIDTAFIEIVLTVRSVSATGVIEGMYRLNHNLATTGFATKNTNIIAVTSGAFDNTVNGSKIGVSVNTGASAAWTFTQVQAELIID